MIILGIDPGVATVGWGVVEFKGNKFYGSDYGAILTPAHTPLCDRIEQIFDEASRLIDYYHVETAAMEKLFFNTNTTTAIDVAQARGVLLLALTKKRIHCSEFTPLQVKQAVTGYGRADKQQVEAMVKMLLKLEKIPRPDDAADALAMAICCAHCLRF
ncbi:MAG: crossover junction endodeoxyribonuclease RuvC [Clostridia bacterium]|nr:crossover junction endodeoxyribonuclease RuvC [Clostridia bacterium]